MRKKYKKRDCHICQRTIFEIVTFIQNNRKSYTISQLCSALKLPRSIYDKACFVYPQTEELGRQVKEAYDDSKQRYGAVQNLPQVKWIQRHMAAQGLRSIVVKKYNHPANQGAVPDDKENILKRDFTAESINQKWCTDITYIHVQKEGWTYLASIMDLCNRKIIGHVYGTGMTAELAV